MLSPKSSHSWIGTFAGRLMQLKPGLDAAPAIRLAVLNHETSSSIPAQKAAERFARRQDDQLDQIISMYRRQPIPPARPRRAFALQLQS